MATDKKADRQHFESMWRKLGNVTEEEIKEVGDFEFEAGPETVQAQLRRYYLLLKIQDQTRAAKMLADLPEINEETLTKEQIVNLCHILRKYWSGFILSFKGEHFSSNDQHSSVRNSTIHYV